MWFRRLSSLLAAAAAFGLGSSAMSQLPQAPTVTTPRVYMLDCGMITNDYPEIWNVTRDEVANTIMANMCFLIVHPKGTMLWDTGIADRFVGRPLGEIQSNKHVSYLKTKTLLGQLADVGYTPEQITFLSLSHTHWDHSGNANSFARSATWLVSQAERDYMFGPNGYARGKSDWDRLQDARTIVIPDDYDVFGDGSVVIKRAPGHTPGHSVAVVKLARTGTVILAGDLYHYPEEITLDRMSDAERKTQSPQSRAMVIAMAKRLSAQIWITHDLALSQRLRHEPAYYD